MKKGIATSIIASICCTWILSFALVGCTLNTSKPEDAFIGTWEMVELTNNGEPVSAGTLDAIRELGMEVVLNFKEDGSCSFSLFGQSVAGTWEATDATTGKMTLENQTYDLRIEDDKLRFEQDGSAFVLARSQEGEKSEQSASAGEVSSASAATSGASAQTPTETPTASSTASEPNTSAETTENDVGETTESAESESEENGETVTSEDEKSERAEEAA